MRSGSRASSFAMLAVSVGLALGVGCGSSSETVTPTCGLGRSRTLIITELGFTREGPKGVAPGFNLDGVVSDGTTQESCGKKDLVDPDGVAGIDNQLALLVPEIEKRVGGTVDGLIQGAINDGRLLILFDFHGVEDLKNAACVSLDVSLGDGRPTLGTDGIMEAFQTFSPRMQNQQLSHATLGKISNKTLEIGPFPLAIPIAIFDVSFILKMREAHLRFTIDDEGNVEGLLGGSVSVDEIADGVKNGAGVADVVAQIRSIGNLFDDRGYDPAEGTCHLLSAALHFKARPAFLRAAATKAP